MNGAVVVVFFNRGRALQLNVDEEGEHQAVWAAMLPCPHCTNVWPIEVKVEVLAHGRADETR